MKYEVINSDGQVVMWTESLNCVPEFNMLKAISAANYRHRVNGRIVACSKVDEAVGRTMPIDESTKRVMKSRRLF